MSVPPKVRCVLTPPPLTLSLSASMNGHTATNTLVELAASNLTPTTAAPSNTSKLTTIQKHAALHPSQPLVAYMLEDPTNSTTVAAVSKRLVVQHTVTRQILDSLSLADLAYLVYRETDSAKIPPAVTSLGTIQSLAFYDPSTLHWSGMAAAGAAQSDGDNNNNDSSKSSAVEDGQVQDHFSLGRRWQTVAIQTTHRILLWNIRQGPSSHAATYPSRKSSQYKRVAASLHEATLGATPSSNLLPLTDHTVLVGCSDGSLKSYDWYQKTVIKSIKGLGKGDWIVQLHAANSFAATSSSSAIVSNKRRILAVTKKGICYLIELEVSEDGGLEIKPPLARFIGGNPEPPTPSDANPMEHVTLTYDAHRDLIIWLSLPPKTKHPAALVWNLTALQADLLKQAGGGKNLFKPDPTMTIRIPTYATESTAGQAMTTAFPILHAAFGEEAVLLATASCTGGDVHLICATANAHNAVNQVTGTGVMAMHLPSMLQADGGLDSAPNVLRIHAVAQAPLMSTCRSSLMLATNLGLIFCDLPSMASASAASSRHVHFGAGLGSLGKSILSMSEAGLVYGSLDVLKPNPVGLMQVKNPNIVYESSAPLHLPPELHKRLFRMAPIFSASPSGMYIAVVWPSEYRYEILHTASLLQKVGQRTSSTKIRNPTVASGHGVSALCWVGDSDVFALLQDEEGMEEATNYMMAPVTLQSGGDEHGGRNPAMSVAKLTSVVTKTATQTVAKTAGAAAQLGLNAATSATSTATKVATKGASKVVKTAGKGMKKSLGLFKKRRNERDDAAADDSETADDDMSHSVDPSLAAAAAAASIQETLAKAAAKAGASKGKHATVELRKLVAGESDASKLSGSVAAATSTSLGELALRGGSRNDPTVIFGGPVLCVGSRTEEDPEGSAHFYTRKPEEKDEKAKVYVSSGPTLPYPDLLVWDDDGVLCAVIVQNRVAVYLSDNPNFTLLGIVRITSSSDTDAPVTSARFIHGTLYCCTFSSVHCVFLGDLHDVCRLEPYMLASTEVPTLSKQAHDLKYSSLMPPSVSLPLILPAVLGYQSGSLVVSTARGVLAVPLKHPLLRIGTLLAAGQVDQACNWFDAVPDADHEALACFLERRGHPDLAMNLPTISLETVVDMSMRHGYIGRLEEAVEVFGAKGLRAIDAGRGVAPNLFGPETMSTSLVVCVGAYLLSHGRVELARLLATECLRSGGEGKKDALVLAALLLPFDEMDATRLVNRAVDEESPENDPWLVGDFARNHIVADRA